MELYGKTNKISHWCLCKDSPVLIIIIIITIIINLLTSVLILSGFSCINPTATQAEQLPKVLNTVFKASPILIFSVIISKSSSVSSIEVRMI